MKKSLILFLCFIYFFIANVANAATAYNMTEDTAVDLSEISQNEQTESFNPNAVVMVAYEQTWLDHCGTLSLKNKTKETIHNVSYRITYLDMNGNPLDYEDYYSEEDIAPGLVKKVDIPAYEAGRFYSYYKSEARMDSPKRFKIKFELLGYNKHCEEDELTIASSDMSADIGEFANGLLRVYACIFLFIFAVVYLCLLFPVAFMARKRNRNVFQWILIGIFITPIVAMLILQGLGRIDEEY